MSISKKYFLLAVFACCCFSLFSSNYAQSFLSVKGKEIIDRNGNPIILRGIGLGGWLVPEG